MSVTATATVTTTATATVAASAPADAAVSSTTPSSPVTAGLKRQTRAKPSAKPAKSITYVVRPGDNLFVIAAWFHLHGYGKLYDRNKAVLGDDPSLIHPGVRITVSSAGMTTS